MPRMSNPADEALKKAFLTVAHRQIAARVDVLLAEADRLVALEDHELIRRESLEFRPDHAREFSCALQVARDHVPHLDTDQVGYVAFLPSRDAGKRRIYVVFRPGTGLMAGHEVEVSEAAWVNSWLRAWTSSS